MTPRAGNVSVIALPNGLHTVGVAVDGRNEGSAAWPEANLAIYMPFTVQVPTVITKLYAGNGSTVSGNCDLGLYARDGTRLRSSGSTGQSGTSVPQIVDITDITIGPGIFYCALARNNTTATSYRSNTTTAVIASTASGFLQQSSAFPLPASATFAAMTYGYYPRMGLLLPNAPSVL